MGLTSALAPVPPRLHSRERGRSQRARQGGHIRQLRGRRRLNKYELRKAAKKSTGQENRMIRTQATGQWLLCHQNMRDKEQDKDPNSKYQVPGLSQG